MSTVCRNVRSAINCDGPEIVNVNESSQAGGHLSLDLLVETPVRVNEGAGEGGIRSGGRSKFSKQGLAGGRLPMHRGSYEGIKPCQYAPSRGLYGSMSRSWRVASGHFLPSPPGSVPREVMVKPRSAVKLAFDNTEEVRCRP